MQLLSPPARCWGFQERGHTVPDLEGEVDLQALVFPVREPKTQGKWEEFHLYC